MLVNTSNFTWRLPLPALGRAGRQAVDPVLDAAPAARKRFPLEGSTTIFPALRPAPQPAPLPLFGSQQRYLLPALQALRSTTEQLGKHPTAEDVDRSNLRRIIHALKPLVYAHRDEYSPKKLKRAMRGLRDMARATGTYKDMSVLEKQVRGLWADEEVPARVERLLSRERKQRRLEFEKAFRRFRSADLERACKVLSRPTVPNLPPSMLADLDRRKLKNHLNKLVDRVYSNGEHADEHERFHAQRKALRSLLVGLRATSALVPTSATEVKRIASAVEGCGLAQDTFVACEWLERHHLEPQAAKARRSYEALHREHGLATVALLSDGCLRRLTKGS